MEIIGQRTKKIMEECKERAKSEGLEVDGETLEYIVTNREMLKLSSKHMIPTLYDFWVFDLEVVSSEWLYDAFPHNPYETVVNTRPALSFYNDNNPDWLNVMIFYHVIAHINFFQNNVTFRKTWSDDFCGQALSDKRLIEWIRDERGDGRRWVDYVIEFARNIDNLVGFHAELRASDTRETELIRGEFSEKTKFYFGKFLREKHKAEEITLNFHGEEVERLNRQGEEDFFDDSAFTSRFPDFASVFKKYQKEKQRKNIPKDLFEYLIENSDFLNKEENEWMKLVMQVIRNTSLYFQPQIRTKIANEGWASYWHEKLFLTDERIKGHEVNYAQLNSKVLVDPKLGFNPYSVGKHLFEFIEKMAKQGRFSQRYQILEDSNSRKHYDDELGKDAGREAIFRVSQNVDDFMFINFLSDNDFQDFINKHQLFVAGMRPSSQWPNYLEVYIKSKSGKKYREMINKHLYHPIHYVIDEEKANVTDCTLYIDHIYEGRSLVTKYIPAVMIALSFFCGGGRVCLETTEFALPEEDIYGDYLHPDYLNKERVRYTCRGKTIKRIVIDDEELVRED